MAAIPFAVVPVTLAFEIIAPLSFLIIGIWYATFGANSSRRG